MPVSITPRALVTGSLRLLGTYAPGEEANIDPLEISQGVEVCNQLIDAWATNELTIPSAVRRQENLVIGQGTYTIGSGGDFDTVTPLAIDGAAILIQPSTPELATELTLSQLTYDGYIAEQIKDLQSPFPIEFYYDQNIGAGFGSIFLWPVPNVVYPLILYFGTPLAPFDTDTVALDTAITLGYGAVRALRFNLALELLPEYPRPDDSATAQIRENARISLGDLKRQNSKLEVLDTGGLFAGPGLYNIYSDTNQ